MFHVVDYDNRILYMTRRLAKHDERNINIKYEERGLFDRAG